MGKQIILEGRWETTCQIRKGWANRQGKGQSRKKKRKEQISASPVSFVLHTDSIHSALNMDHGIEKVPFNEWYNFRNKGCPTKKLAFLFRTSGNIFLCSFLLPTHSSLSFYSFLFLAWLGFDPLIIVSVSYRVVLCKVYTLKQVNSSKELAP